jgi:hypothetical protein
MATSFDEHSINQGIVAMAGLAAWRILGKAVLGT